MRPFDLFKRVRSTVETLRSHLWDLRSAYYLVGEAEPVTQILEPGVAWVVTGQHGDTLVSRNLAIWDVDDIPNPYPTKEHQVFDGEQLTNKGPQPESSDEKILMIIRQRLEAVPGKCYRVYRTYAGVRVICSSHPICDVSPVSDRAWFKRVGSALKADRRYMRISDRQKASRARLKPKSKDSRFLFDDDDRGNGDRRCCRYLGPAGDGTPTHVLEKQIEFHDSETLARDERAWRLY